MGKLPDEWHNELKDMNIKGFCKDVEKLKVELEHSIGEDDYKHLKQVKGMGRLFNVIGYSTAWIFPNPISIFFLSMGTLNHLLLMHHIKHRGYDKVPNIPEKYTSKRFARGWRRFVDCFDWWPMNDWDYVHNELHHYHTNEPNDADDVHRLGKSIRESKAPKFIKYIMIFFFTLTWKFTIYAPNMVSAIDPKTKKWVKPEDIRYITLVNIFNLRNGTVRRLWLTSYLPYIIFNFVIIPLLFFPLGWTAVIFVLINKILAELLINAHTAMVIFPNHCADDVYSYNFHFKNKEEFYIMQVLSTANYKTDTEMEAYMAVWLNYQIEHHLFPDLPMLKYRQIQPRVKALCEKHHIPYKQEGVLHRNKKVLQYFLEGANLRELHEFPQPAD